MQALAKQKLKQKAACLEAWCEAAKQGQVHLKGAGSMLQWRKLLRVWKVGSSHLAALLAILYHLDESSMACQQPRCK